ncbi:MAG: YqzL family protein [Cellulosilyticaceae bacterium]
MIDNLWKCFETTGDIQTYLSFKEYEKMHSMTNGEDNAQIRDGLLDDGMSKE